MVAAVQTAAALAVLVIVAGLGPYGYSFKRQQFETFLITTLYTFAIITLFCTFYLRDVYSDISSGNFDVYNVGKLYSHMNIIGSIVCYVIPIIYVRKQVRFLNISKAGLNEIINFFNDGELYKLEIIKVSLKALFMPILLQTTLIIRAVHFEPDRSLLWVLYTFIPYAIRTTPSTSVYGIFLLCSAFLKSIKLRTQAIVDEVNRMHTHKEWLSKTAYQRMQRYCELSDMIDDLNDKYARIVKVIDDFLEFQSLPWLTSILCNVVGIMLGFYTQYKAIADNLFNGKEYDFYNVVTDSAYMLISFLEMYTQSEVSSNITEAAQQTGAVLQGADAIDADIRLRQTMDLFSLRILQKNLKIKPLGLFEVNVSLIHGVFSTVIGFLLILIQSDLSKRFLQ